jgi:hypothetical protein
MFFYVPVICCQETSVAVKKETLSSFVSVNTLLFSMQYGHTSFPCVLQQKPFHKLENH